MEKKLFVCIQVKVNNILSLTLPNQNNHFQVFLVSNIVFSDFVVEIVSQTLNGMNIPASEMLLEYK